MTANRNAPEAATTGATTEPPTNQDQKETAMTIIAGAEQPRYVVTGTDVFDRQTKRVAKFKNTGVAQLGADWLNGPDATPGDYEWSDLESRCAYAWCTEDHARSLDPLLHIKQFEYNGIRFDFVLDEAPDARNRVYLNWTDMFEVELAPADLGELNDIAAAFIVGKAAFEQFAESVTA